MYVNIAILTRYFSKACYCVPIMENNIEMTNTMVKY